LPSLINGICDSSVSTWMSPWWDKEGHLANITDAVLKKKN